MRKILLFSVVLAFGFSAMAQDRTVTGRVTSTEDGTTLPGVNVVLKGTTIGTSTDADGRFSMSVPASGGSLIFSFIGLQSKEIEIGDRSVIDVSLALDVTQLSEVVVVGYGTQDKRTLTSSISSVSGEDLALKPVPSFDVALQGRASGVMVNITNGLVGQAPRIRIRGTNSITSGQSPLFVVDGVPMLSGDASGVAPNNLLGDINPADVESFEVLKDGAATAIYGSRAANGVILITTKQGKSGKPKVSYDFQIGANTIATRYDVLNAREFVQLQNEKLATSGIAAPQAFPGDNNVDTDWQDIIFRNGTFQNHNLSVSGGSEDWTYYFSTGITKQEGAVVNNSMDRYTMMAKVDYSGVKWLSTGMKIGLTRQVNNGLNTGSNALSGNVPGAIYAFPNISPFDASHPTGYSITDDNRALGRGNNLLDIASSYTNQRYVLDHNKQEADTYRVLASMYGQANILDGLNLKTQFGVDVSDAEDFLTWNPVHGDGGGSTAGIVFRQAGRILRWNWQNSLNFRRTFAEDHNVAITVGNEYQLTTSRSFFGQGTTFSDPFFLKYDLISNTFATQESGGGFTEDGFESIFFRATYDFNGRYLLSFSGRNDALSKLPEENRQGTFFGGSLGWVVTQENFFNVPFISELKVRASYAEVGNTGFGNFEYVGTYAPEQYGSQSGIVFDNVGNSALKWEVSSKLDFGIDFSVMNNRITGSIDYFKNLAEDLILESPTPPTAGIPGNNIVLNVGNVENTGFEITIGSENLTSGPLRWHTDLTFTSQKNVVTETGDGGDIVGNFTIIREGESFQALYGYIYRGVNSVNGNPIYEKADGTLVQGNIDNQTYYVYDPNSPSDFSTSTTLTSADKKILGTTLPKFFGGINNRLTYKDFDFEVFVTYSGGNKVMNGSRQVGLHMDFKNNLREILNRWTPENPNTDVPRMYYTRGNFINQEGNASTRFVEDGDYFRIQDITLGYTMPRSLLSSFANGSLQKVRVFAQVRNAFTFTKYRGPDPEANSGGQGVDFLTNPLLRTYTVGVSIGL